MAPANPIIVVTGEPETASAVAAALNANGRSRSTEVCATLPDLVRQMARSQPAAVLVDIDPNPTGALQALEPLVSKFRDTRFIVLASQLSNDLIFEAMQVGARHFLLKRSIPEELSTVLRRLIPDHPAGEYGEVLTVLSAGGGCGATTLSINLANELALIASETALLVDLDACYGAIGPYLGVQGDFGIADVLGHGPRIDASLVRSSARPYADKLHVLLSPVSINFPKPLALRYEYLGDALEACKQSYAFTVIDAPRLSMEAAATVAGASRLVLVALQLTVKDIQIARFMMEALAGYGIPEDRVLAVINRYHRKGGPIRLDEARRALGTPQVRCVDNDFRSAVQAINFGQPLAQTAPTSALRRAIRELAAEIRLQSPAAKASSDA